MSRTACPITVPFRKNRRNHVKYAILLFGSGLLLYQILDIIIIKTEHQIIVSDEQKNVSNSKHHLLKMNPKFKMDDRQQETITTFKTLNFDKEFAYPLYINLKLIVENKINNPEYKIVHRPVNPHPFHYIHNPSPCNFSTGKINHTAAILVLIKSSVNNTDLRNSVRMSWARGNGIRNFRAIFTLGFNDAIQKDIEEEFRLYGDIVQENFVDAYRNNTLKTIMGFNWAMQYCSDTDFLFFVDDDYFVKIHEVVKYLRKKVRQNRNRDIFVGSMSYKGIPFRDKNSKWYVSYEDYPFNKYPHYIGGGAYLVSKNYAKKFHIAFPYVKRIAVDDAYLGIVAKKLDIHPRNDPYFFPRGMGSFVKECTHNATNYLNHKCSNYKQQPVFKRNEQRHAQNKLFWVLILFILFFFSFLLCCIIPLTIFVNK